MQQGSPEFTNVATVHFIVCQILLVGILSTKDPCHIGKLTPAGIGHVFVYTIQFNFTRFSVKTNHWNQMHVFTTVLSLMAVQPKEWLKLLLPNRKQEQNCKDRVPWRHFHFFARRTEFCPKGVSLEKVPL